MRSSPHISAGFTLIETLVAVSIITLAVAGPFFAAERAIVAAAISRDKLIASYLAQEGIEYIHAMRNDTVLYDYPLNIRGDQAFNSDFLNGTLNSSITQCRGAGDGTTACELDPSLPMGTGSTNALHVCASLTDCHALRVSGGAYSLTGGTATPFVRSIIFYDVGIDEQVVSQVAWTEHNTTYTVRAVTYLSPWQ